MRCASPRRRCSKWALNAMNAAYLGTSADTAEQRSQKRHMLAQGLNLGPKLGLFTVTNADGDGGEVRTPREVSVSDKFADCGIVPMSLA